MLTISTAAAATAGVVMALWLFVGVWALVSGLALRKRATYASLQADRLAALLDTAPALPVVVRADGRVEAPARLAEWLGLIKAPGFVTDFATRDAGLSGEDAAALVRDVSAAQRTGARFTRGVRAVGSDRTLLIRGGPAPSLVS